MREGKGENLFAKRKIERWKKVKKCLKKELKIETKIK